MVRECMRLKSIDTDGPKPPEKKDFDKITNTKKREFEIACYEKKLKKAQ